MEDVAYGALVQVRPVFGDLIVKVVQGFDSSRHFLHHVLVPLAPLGDHRILALDELAAQPSDRILPHQEGVSEGFNGGHHGISSTLVPNVAEGDNLFA